jgi:molecular chaperone DnaK (HSP70)
MQSLPITHFFPFAAPARTVGTPRRFLVLTFALLLVYSFAGVVRAQTKDLTVEDYCRLTVSLMELSVQEWQERIPVAEKTKSDRKKLEAALQDATKRYRDLRGEKYKEFGLDQSAYLHYATDHKTEIESYLEDNPDVQQAIDNLKKQIDKLIEQFEAAAPPQPKGGDQ